MKWSELTWKERKQIYDTVRADNPNASYLDIKQQFDNIPEYEDGVMLHYADQDYINWKKRLPQNLQESYGYNLYGAYKSGAVAKLDEGDGYYHLPTRNPHTGEILKYPSHPTFYYGLAKDIELGYYPVVKGGKTYTIKAYENGKDVIDFVNKSDANFVYRLKTPFRNTIDDWETQYISPYIGKPSMRGDWKYKSISTHKMAYGEPYGEPVVWPLVQEVNGKLIDFTRPPYHPWAALDTAEQTGDYIKFPTIDSAKWFTENYKNYYPSFENGKEGNPKLPIEYAVPLTIADLANTNNTNNN